ncbi:MAG: PAS domain S-box protein [Halanaeroarchaeum sp.]
MSVRQMAGSVRVVLVASGPSPLPATALEAALSERGLSASVARYESANAALGDDPDCVVARHGDADDAFRTIETVRGAVPDVATVVLADTETGDAAVRAVNEDVDRYVDVGDTHNETATALASSFEECLEDVSDGPSPTVREREYERYATVVQASGDPVYTLDASGTVTFANEALVTMTGYDRAEILGSHVSKVMDDEHVGRGERLIRRILASETETRGTFEMDVHTKDGDTVACENHVAILPSEDGFRGTVGVLRDITERKERERRLQEERDRFTAVFETIPEPIAHVRFEGATPTLEHVNSTFEETFGVDRDGVVGRSVGDALVPDELAEDVELLDAAPDDEFVERSIRRPTAGGERDFLVRATHFDVGDDRESIVAYLDITVQKERQRELERQNQRLDEFASVVSHDLRNPLTVAQGRLELARNGSDDHLDHVESALERMEALVENLLALAVEGETVTDVEPVALVETAEQSWDLVDTGSATLETDGDATFEADPSRVRSLFENLFRNAVEHGDDEVTVRVTPIEGGFAVEDDGPGLPDDPAIFRAGYSTNDGGTGFGLNIVEDIVEAHGWSIEATDAETGGARFEVTGLADESVDTPTDLSS